MSRADEQLMSPDITNDGEFFCFMQRLQIISLFWRCRLWTLSSLPVTLRL